MRKRRAPALLGHACTLHAPDLDRPSTCMPGKVRIMFSSVRTSVDAVQVAQREQARQETDQVIHLRQRHPVMQLRHVQQAVAARAHKQPRTHAAHGRLVLPDQRHAARMTRCQTSSSASTFASESAAAQHFVAMSTASCINQRSATCAGCQCSKVLTLSVCLSICLPPCLRRACV